MLQSFLIHSLNHSLAIVIELSGVRRSGGLFRSSESGGCLPFCWTDLFEMWSFLESQEKEKGKWMKIPLKKIFPDTSASLHMSEYGTHTDATLRRVIAQDCLWFRIVSDLMSPQTINCSDYILISLSNVQFQRLYKQLHFFNQLKEEKIKILYGPEW